jgi:O-antigen/teichoic acid export membrane protein
MPPLLSVKARTAAGATWTIVGYGVQQVLRLGSNLVLTRLLVPEAFGLMTLATIFITGLEMLSDVGVGPSIIQSKMGDDTRFLDTAWTIQIFRGFVLFIAGLLVAWPAARFYSEPRLLPLMAANCVGIAIRGFTPTRLHSLNRKVLMGRLTLMESTCQVLTVGITVCAAWALRSAWSLVIGYVVGDIARVGLSYIMLPGHRHRLHINREAAGEIARVGRWVILSSAVTFAAGNLDRLAMGRMLSVRELGIYGIAFNLMGSLVTVGRTMGSRVFFPILAETIRESPERLYRRFRKARLAWAVPTIAGLLLFAVLGEWIVHVLYPRVFQDAGWMLRILAAGSIVAVLNQTTGTIWPALGEFRTITVLMIVQVATMFAAMMIGSKLFGTVGFVVGIASVELLVYPVQAVLIARRKLWQPEVDLPLLAASAVVVALGAFIR